MHRKRTDCSPHYKMYPSTNSIKNSGQHEQVKQIEIKLYITQQHTPMSISVPIGCNMKILKSILYFNLKNTMHSTEYGKVVGFETMPADYQTDYKLHLGIGELKHNLNLLCLNQPLKNQADSLLNYKICKLISIGGFSKVYLLRDLRTGDFMAGKFINKQSANLDLVQNQFIIASHLHHPNIIQTHHFIQTQHFYVIVMQFLPGGQLFDLLKSHRHMPEEQARFYMVETLLALEYLHKLSIIYRDIKPQNIIIDHEGHIKLTDFGLAKLVKNRSYSFCGSLDYMAPEIIEQTGYSYQIDYYSVGNLLFQILLGSPPFYHPKYTQQQTKHHILYTEVKFTQSMELSPAVMDLLARLLEKKPEDRLGHKGGIDQILGHKWFQDIDLEAYRKKLVEPPIKAEQKILTNEEGVEEQQEWRMLIDADMKKQRIKQEFNCQKQKRSNFNTRKSCDEADRNHNSSQKKSQGRLKSNLSLLYVMTQKRSSSSVCPPRKLMKSIFNKSQIKAAGMFNSLNMSRKSSMMGLNQNKPSIRSVSKFKRESSQPDLSQNFILQFSKKNKQNGNPIRKKGKQLTTIVKFGR